MRSRAVPYLVWVNILKIWPRRFERRAFGLQMNRHFRDQESGTKYTSRVRIMTNLLEVYDREFSNMPCARQYIPFCLNSALREPILIPVLCSTDAVSYFEINSRRESKTILFSTLLLQKKNASSDDNLARGYWAGKKNSNNISCSQL